VTGEHTLRALNADYIRSLLIADVAWFREHLAEEFVSIEADASVLDKAAFLRRTAEGSPFATYRLEDVAVSFYGDVALVRATGSWVATNGSQGVSRYVDVYARLEGAWRVVSAQITRPPSAAST
jgi:hypothetical protein